MNALKILNQFGKIRNIHKICSPAALQLKYWAFNYIRVNTFINKNVPLVTFDKSIRKYTTSEELVDEITYEKVCEDTLESLCEYFEEIIEDSSHLQAADVTYGVNMFLWFQLFLKKIRFTCTHNLMVLPFS